MTQKAPPKRRVDGFAAFWRAPAIIWQSAFFIAPLGLLVAMTFWRVENYRLTPDFVTSNWERMFTRGFFWTAYEYTFLVALMVAVLASLIAFPAAHYLAMKANPSVRRWGIFLLITPFFTSYLVRIYSWKIILSAEGVINVGLGYLGLEPLSMIDNLFGATIGYLTLCMPLTLMIQYFALSNVDKSLIEAAQNLGCSALKATFKVTIPAAKIGLILAATFAFILTFGDYVSPTYLGGGSPPTMSILIVDQTKSGNHWPRASVVAVTMILTLITVLFAALFAAYGRPGKAK